MTKKKKANEVKTNRLGVCQDCGMVFSWAYRDSCPDCGGDNWVRLTNDEGRLIDIDDLYNLIADFE